MSYSDSANSKSGVPIARNRVISPRNRVPKINPERRDLREKMSPSMRRCQHMVRNHVVIQAHGCVVLTRFGDLFAAECLYKKDQETTRNYQLPGMGISGPVRVLVQAVREVRGFRGSGKRRIKLHSARF